MSEFTRGPWRLEMHNGFVYTDHGSDWLFGPNGKPIIHFHQESYDSEAFYEFEDEDAYLIASAPDLLAALERLVSYGDIYRHKAGEISPYEQAKAAIAKATGGDHA